MKALSYKLNKETLEVLLKRPDLLNSMSSKEKDFLLIHSFEKGWYKELIDLANILDSKDLYGSLMHKMINEIGKGSIEATKIVVSINHRDWKDFTYEKLIDISINSTDEIRKPIKEYVEIAKLIANDMQEIPKSALFLLSKVLNKKDFYEIINKKNIDLTKYEGLFFTHYDLEEMKPLFILPEKDNHHPIDWLKSVTYIDPKALSTDVVNESSKEEIDSKIFTINDADKIYRDFFSLTKESKEMMIYLSYRISQGLDVKIFFSSDFTIQSSYEFESHVIKVGLKTDSLDPFHNIYSTFAHELGHAFYHLLFDQQALPYDDFGMKKLGRTKEYFNYDNDEDFVISEWFVSRLEVAKEMINYFPGMIKNYNALIKPVGDISLEKELGDELLRSTRDLLEGISIDYYPLYSLFSTNSMIGKEYGLEGSLITINIRAISTIALYTHVGECEISPYGEHQEKTIDEMSTYLLEKYLPHFISYNQLSSEQVFVIERVADALARSTSHNHYKYENVFAEFAAHYWEFKALGFSQENTAMYEGIFAVHQRECNSKILKILPNINDEDSQSLCLNTMGQQVLCSE